MLFTAVLLSLAFISQPSVSIGTSVGSRVDPGEDASRLALPAAESGSDLQEYLPAIERVFDEELGGELLAGLLESAADEADPVGEADPADEAPQLRPGQAADVAKAVLAHPPVKSALDNAKAAALAKVKADWDKLKTGQKAAVLVVAAPLGTGVIAGVLKTPSLYKPAQDLLNIGANTLLQQKVPWLTVRFDFVSSQKSFGLTVDLLPLLRRAGVPF